MQLVSYGCQDLFLTGAPQITFFKIVYRRYTNFSIEPVHQDFVGTMNFGNKMTCTIEKMADLMGQIYVEFELPEVSLVKPLKYNLIDFETAKCRFEQIGILYKLISSYIKVNSDTARCLLKLLKIDNMCSEEFKNLVLDQSYFTELDKIKHELQEWIASNQLHEALEPDKMKYIYQIENCNVGMMFERIYVKKVTEEVVANKQSSIINEIDDDLNAINDRYVEPTVSKVQSCESKCMTKFLTVGMYQQMKDIYEVVYKIYQREKEIYHQFVDKTYKETYDCAWVEAVGNAVIDTVDFRIGSEMIDRQTGDFMIALTRLYQRQYQVVNNQKLLGNIPELITFDDRPKPSRKLYVPLFFWFCRNPGLFFPLVSIRYQDIAIDLCLKTLEKVFYVGTDTQPKDMGAIQDKYGINMKSIKLWVNYVYLDHDERRRFAQSSHEYLIEVVQYNEFKFDSSIFNADLVFCHPTKYMFWFAQPMSYRENPDGTNKCQWTNWATHPDKTGYTMAKQVLRLNGYERFDPDLPPVFFNYVQPYLYFLHSPVDGLSTYSFATNPMEHQPSGSCDMSRIDDITLNIQFTPEFVALMRQTGQAYFATYTLAYDILRIASGYGALAFQTSY